MLAQERQHRERRARIQERFGAIPDLTEEEMLKYALMISKEETHISSSRSPESREMMEAVLPSLDDIKLSSNAASEQSESSLPSSFGTTGSSRVESSASSLKDGTPLHVLAEAGRGTPSLPRTTRPRLSPYLFDDEDVDDYDDEDDEEGGANH